MKYTTAISLARNFLSRSKCFWHKVIVFVLYWSNRVCWLLKFQSKNQVNYYFYTLRNLLTAYYFKYNRYTNKILLENIQELGEWLANRFIGEIAFATVLFRQCLGIYVLHQRVSVCSVEVYPLSQFFLQQKFTFVSNLLFQKWDTKKK